MDDSAMSSHLAGAPPEPARLVTLGPRAASTGVRPAVVMQAMLLLIVVANLGRIPVLSTGEREAPLLVNDLCVACIVGAGLLVCLRAKSLELDSVALLALAFATVGGVSAVLAVPRFGLDGFQLAVSLAYLARWLVYFGVYVAVINTVRRDEVDGVWHAAETALLLFAGFGILQTIFLPGFAQMVYPSARPYYDWDIQGRRLVSTLLDPNVAGAFILVGVLVALARIAVGARVAWWKVVVLITGLLLTLSRSAVLGLLAGGVVILVARGLSKRVLRALAVLVGLFALASPALLRFAAGYHKLGFDASAADRLVSWLRALQAFRDHPVIGVGFNTFGYVLEKKYDIQRFGAASYSSDGGLLFVAVLTGGVGLAIFLWMLWRVIRNARSAWRDPDASPSHRGLAIGAAAAVVGVCVHSLFVNSLLQPFVMELLWVLWGLAFVLRVPEGERVTTGSSLIPH